jgi:hypothetical protein
LFLSDLNGNLIKAPNKTKMQMIYMQMKNQIRIISKELENYSGDNVLLIEENLKKSERIIFNLVRVSTRLVIRLVSFILSLAIEI